MSEEYRVKKITNEAGEPGVEVTLYPMETQRVITFFANNESSQDSLYERLSSDDGREELISWFREDSEPY